MISVKVDNSENAV